MLMRLSVAVTAAFVVSAPAAGQGTCWRPRSPAECRHYVVTDLAVGYWLTPTSNRFDRNRSRVLVTGDLGYLRAVGPRDAVGLTLGTTFYNRRSDYAGLEWFYPDVAEHVMARWDHWLGASLALRGGVGTPLGGGRRGATVAKPGLDVELGLRSAGRIGVMVRMERQRLDDQVFTYPALPGLTYPLSDPGVGFVQVSTTRTDWYVGVTTHGWMGLGFGVATLMALFSTFAFSS